MSDPLLDPGVFTALARTVRQLAGSARVYADAFLEWQQCLECQVGAGGPDQALKSRQGVALRTVRDETERLAYNPPGLLPGWLPPVAAAGPVHLMAAQLAAAARAVAAADPAVVRCRAICRQVRRGVAVVNSEGVQRWQYRVTGGLALGVAVRGRDRTHTVVRHRPLPDALDPAALAAVRAWAGQVLAGARVRQEAVPVAAGEWCVILAAGAPAAIFHEACGHGLEGDHVISGRSAYAGLTGCTVASPLVTVVDDPTLPDARGSYPFDDEGTPAGRTVLIESGVLRGYLHDRQSAARLGVAPTGHGRRAAYRHAPMPRMGNTVILPGRDDPAGIIAATPRGLLVTGVEDGGTDPSTGHFRVRVSEAFLVGHGRVGAPVYGATLVGVGGEVIRRIDRVGSDLAVAFTATGGCLKRDAEPLPVAFGQPTLRVSRLWVEGVAG